MIDFNDKINFNYNTINKNDTVLSEHYNDIKIVFSKYLNKNLIDTIIDFIDIRKRCNTCKIFFIKNNIYPKYCEECKTYHCDNCIGLRRHKFCSTRDCYYCNREFCYYYKSYYVCILCENKI